MKTKNEEISENKKIRREDKIKLAEIRNEEKLK